MRKNKGFTLIELLIVIAVIAILAAIAIPNLLASRKAANESSAISSLRTLVSAEETYRSRINPPVYGTMADLLGKQLVDPLLGAGSKSGYTFTYVPGADTNSYGFTAAPQANAGERYFSVDQTGVIRSDTAAIAPGAGTAIQ